MTRRDYMLPLCCMIGYMKTKLRLSTATEDILVILANAPPGTIWGLKLAELSGRSHGAIYPALSRLLVTGWVTVQMEKPIPEDRPPRHYYTVTDAGRVAYETMLAHREELGAQARNVDQFPVTEGAE